MLTMTLWGRISFRLDKFHSLLIVVKSQTLAWGLMKLSILGQILLISRESSIQLSYKKLMLYLFPKTYLIPLLNNFQRLITIVFQTSDVEEEFLTWRKLVELFFKYLPLINLNQILSGRVGIFLFSKKRCISIFSFLYT